LTLTTSEKKSEYKKKHEAHRANVVWSKTSGNQINQSMSIGTNTSNRKSIKKTGYSTNEAFTRPDSLLFRLTNTYSFPKNTNYLSVNIKERETDAFFFFYQHTFRWKMILFHEAYLWIVIDLSLISNDQLRSPVGQIDISNTRMKLNTLCIRLSMRASQFLFCAFFLLIASFYCFTTKPISKSGSIWNKEERNIYSISYINDR